jgi:gamma-glutamylcyclotransferase (GGCT)/AIG2-like uncharacterized protein YtfP
MPATDPTAVAPPRLFVYGTLQPDRLRWPLLEPYATGHRPATVPGTLYDSGNGWPVVDFAARDHDVPGVLVDLDPGSLDEALGLLDHVEGTVTDLLRRIVVTTRDGLSAWAYHWPGATSGMRRIDRWDPTDER